MFSGRFLLRDPSGFWKATRFLKQPDQYDHLLKALREVLQEACGLTPEQALGYSCHNPRHFLPARKHEIICARMTDLYSQHSTIVCPITILKRQMDDLRSLSTERGHSSHMPSREGWSDLVPFRSTGQEYDMYLVAGHVSAQLHLSRLAD